MNFDVFHKKEGAVELCVLLLVVHVGRMFYTDIYKPK